MAKRCVYCGKGPMAGRVYTRKGKAKKEGGVGRKVARKNIRRFMPNLQAVRALLNGVAKRVLVCTKCLKAGRLIRPAV